jgi:SAM-dependent methyltransferase
MESIRCNLCDTGKTDLLFSKKDKFRISEDDFNVVRCKNCGLIYVNPRPTQEEIAKFYPDTYSWKETLKAASFFSRIIRKTERAYRYHNLNYEVKKVLEVAKINSGKVLDLGCGAGDRLDIFRQKGFDTHGVEISSAALYARDFFKLNVIQGDLYKASYPDDFFDIVSVYNVLEHTHAPKDVLKALGRVTKDGGVLALQVPNSRCLQFKIFKKQWAACDVPRDLCYFNDGLLKKILADCGFQVLCVDHFSNWWHPPTIVTSLFPGLDPQKSWLVEKEEKSSTLRRCCWIFWTLLLPLFTFLESLVGRGAIITVYAKKIKQNRDSRC